MACVGARRVMTTETKQYLIRLVSLVLAVTLAALAGASSYGGLGARVEANTKAIESKADSALVREMFDANRRDHEEIKRLLMGAIVKGGK